MTQGAFHLGEQKFLMARIGTLIPAKDWSTPPKFLSKNSKNLLILSENTLFGP